MKPDEVVIFINMMGSVNTAVMVVIPCLQMVRRINSKVLAESVLGPKTGTYVHRLFLDFYCGYARPCLPLGQLGVSSF